MILDRFQTEIDVLSDLPTGRASGQLTEACLVLEGGAFRGLYSQGVLDCFMQAGLLCRAVIGVSAGALSGLNYVSGQIGRSARINLEFREDSHYIGVKAFAESGSILNLDFLTDHVDQIYPFDYQAFNQSEQRFVAVATNCLTGQAEYFEKAKTPDIIQAVKASATIPFISPKLMVEDKPCMDGGCACKIPYRWAIDQGYDKIIVVQTRPEGFRKSFADNPIVSRLASRVYADYPAFVECLQGMDQRYNRELGELELLAEQGRLYCLQPSQDPDVATLEGDLQKLRNLYDLGRTDAESKLPEIWAYLQN